MKISTSIDEEYQVFKPFTLHLRIETEEELKQIFCLFNHTVILNTLNISYGETIRQNLMGCSNGGIRYSDLFNKLDNAIIESK